MPFAGIVAVEGTALKGTPVVLIKDNDYKNSDNNDARKLGFALCMPYINQTAFVHDCK